MLYGKLPIVFLSTLASEKKDSTNSQIATYLLNHLDDIMILVFKRWQGMFCSDEFYFKSFVRK